MKDRRNQQLSKIHIAKKDLGMDDDSYRAMLVRIAGKTSAKDLSPLQTANVLRELERLGWQPKRGRAKPKPAADRAKLVSKIEAQLADAGRPWAYGDGIAKRLYKVEKVEWLNPEQLRGVVAALAYDAKRHGRQHE
ncbi:regulatory protein GemA [Pseudomonas sp. FFUP_PS_473]|uniref:gp16 family protein n=1 Tax=Pseudomonas sp. FFUP_PS_473 TaxID=2060418 RepID=UPI000C7AF656|nr:regulatory protein GemA [Pseudomonas sp. FFUP_PS_473]PLP96027.1 regulatory protein GemA [Pseudomonas sp. FFUP_PS_473]